MTSFAEIAKLYHTLSQQVMNDYPQLKDWEYRYNHNLTNAMGRCIVKNGGEKYIEISTRLIAVNLQSPHLLEQIKNTILHEWAHALDYEKDKKLSHSHSWRLWMIKLGIKPERCWSDEYLLALPRGKNYAIRNKHTGNIFNYFKHQPTQSDLINACNWHFVLKKRPIHEELEIVNLKTAIAQNIA